MKDLAVQLGEVCRDAQAVIACAESCTAGWIGKRITDVPGSSAWFDRGFICYSNDAKNDMLGVDVATLAEHGAVSEAVVREMVTGALAHSRASIAVAVTGIAGPDGGTEDKPVGTVWIGWCKRGEAAQCERRQFSGDRENVRRATVRVALEGIIRRVSAEQVE